MDKPTNKHSGIPMNGITYFAVLTFSSLAIAPLGALFGASLDRQYTHVCIMLYWIGGFATLSHVAVVLGS
jgi:hypothetical protein